MAKSVKSKKEIPPVDLAIYQAREDMEYYALCRGQLRVACNDILDSASCSSEQKAAYITLHDALIKQELDACRRMLTMAALSDSKVSIKARLDAAKKYLGKGMEIMSYLRPKGRIGSYWTSEETNFRNNIELQIKELEKELKRK